MMVCHTFWRHMLPLTGDAISGMYVAGIVTCSSIQALACDRLPATFLGGCILGNMVPTFT